MTLQTAADVSVGKALLTAPQLAISVSREEILDVMITVHQQ